MSSCIAFNYLVERFHVLNTSLEQSFWILIENQSSTAPHTIEGYMKLYTYHLSNNMKDHWMVLSNIINVCVNVQHPGRPRLQGLVTQNPFAMQHYVLKFVSDL